MTKLTTSKTPSIPNYTRIRSNRIGKDYSLTVNTDLDILYLTTTTHTHYIYRTTNGQNPYQQTHHNFQPMHTTMRCSFTSLCDIQHRHNKLHTTLHQHRRFYTHLKSDMNAHSIIWYSYTDDHRGTSPTSSTTLTIKH